MKTKEELSALKKEVEAIGKKLAELSEDELKQVIGGVWLPDLEGSVGLDAELSRLKGGVGDPDGNGLIADVSLLQDAVGDR